MSGTRFKTNNVKKRGVAKNKLNKFRPTISASVTATPKDQRTRGQLRRRLSRAPREHLPRKSRRRVSRKGGPRTIVEYMVAPASKPRSGLPPVHKLSAGQRWLAGAAPSATGIAASTDTRPTSDAATAPHPAAAPEPTAGSPATEPAAPAGRKTGGAGRGVGNP